MCTVYRRDGDICLKFSSKKQLKDRLPPDLVKGLHRHTSNANANAMLFNRPEGIPHIQVYNFSIHGDFAACSGKVVF
jgi:hypothetical protein